MIDRYVDIWVDRCRLVVKTDGYVDIRVDRCRLVVKTDGYVDISVDRWKVNFLERWIGDKISSKRFVEA